MPFSHRNPVYAAIVLTDEDHQRFHTYVNRSGQGCWPWTGARSSNGYGSFHLRVGGRWRSFTASRVAWTIANNRQPTGHVCHECDNPICCRPDHLWLGTHWDNMEDMRVKGRSGFNGSIPNTGTDCLNGHEYTPENTRMNGKQRICRECNRLACQRYHERRAAKQEAA